jgi:transposase
MSQSLLYHAFGVREGYEYRSTEYVGGSTEFVLAVEDKMLVCPKCGKRESVIRKGRRERRIQTLPIGMRSTWLRVEVPRCRCKECDETFEVSPPLPSPTFTSLEDLPIKSKRSRK